MMLRIRLLHVTLTTTLVIIFLSFISFNTKYIFRSYSSSPQNITFLETSSNLPHFTLLIGILTLPDKYEHRGFLRLVYGAQPQDSPIARIEVKFVFCNLTNPEQRVFIALEIMVYNDIIILDCPENMNSGKTYAYFSSLPRMFPNKYDYVMKADDDVFLRLEPLALSLATMPRQDLYYGFVIPCPSMNPFVYYMSGMGFVLSWDIVEWISTSLIPSSNTIGPEDKLVGQWLDTGNKARNRFSNKPAMYDYPGTNGRCSHDLIPETIAVHRIKRWDQWLHVLDFFNVTKNMKPSNQYHF